MGGVRTERRLNRHPGLPAEVSPIPCSFPRPSWPFGLVLAYAGRREGSMAAAGDRGGPWPGAGGVARYGRPVVG